MHQGNLSSYCGAGVLACLTGCRPKTHTTKLNTGGSGSIPILLVRQTNNLPEYRPAHPCLSFLACSGFPIRIQFFHESRFSVRKSFPQAAFPLGL
jgi:hypothetical protein